MESVLKQGKVMLEMRPNETNQNSLNLRKEDVLSVFVSNPVSNLECKRRNPMERRKIGFYRL